jgi:hypothetical protein
MRQDLVVDDDRHARGAGEAQQFRKHVRHVRDEVAALGQPRQHRHHDAPHVEAEPEFLRVLARFDAQGQDLAELLAGRALVERDGGRRRVMAGDQSPQLALDDQRHGHRGQRLHVAHVLQVHRGDAAQRGERQVVGAAGDGIDGGDEGRRHIARVLDQADARQRVQFARLRRDVRRGEVLAQVGMVALVPRFRRHAAMAVRVELVHHHAAEARHGADVLAGQHRHRSDVAGAVGLLQEVADERIQVAEIGRTHAVDGLEFEDHQAIPAVADHVVMAFAHGPNRADILGTHGQPAGEAVGQVLRSILADDRRQRPADGGGGLDAGQRAQVGACLQHLQSFRQCQQEAVRLDAAGRADRFPVAGGQVKDGGGLGHEESDLFENYKFNILH